MAFFECAGAKVYFETVGEGAPIITTHGVAENGLYWKLPGVVDRLVGEGYQVISMDMRGHGRSVVLDGDAGFNVATVASDFGALADHLGLARFHLLSHATGGMAALRFAMGHHHHLISLMSTNTASATIPSNAASRINDFDAPLDMTRPPPNRMAAAFRGRTWYEIITAARRTAGQDVFLSRMKSAVDPDAAFAWYEATMRLGDPDTLARFMDAFYDDPDPYVARLRNIACPCLVLVGEADEVFLEPSRQLAREIPGARLVEMRGRGHMTAFEDPIGTADILCGFLADLAMAGEAI